MNRFLKYICLILVISMPGCYLMIADAPLALDLTGDALGVGTPALPYYVYSDTTLEAINRELKKANAEVTLEDTYRYGYKKSFKSLGPEGDTGQRFSDMETATFYLQNILRAKGVPNAGNYFLTSIDSAKGRGFTLIAAVHREEEEILVYDKFDASSEETLTCDEPSFYRPYRFDCAGNPLDTVYEWAAVPNDCFEKQGQQAILLTLTANKILEKEPKNNFWEAEEKWIAGNFMSVIVDQDYMVCQALGIEPGYIQRRNIFKD
jgi:hypothetical protein